MRVLARMEEAGVRVDVEFLRELSVELTKECGELEARIHAAAGERFNVNSTPQLRRILFEKLGLTPVKKTKTGAVDRRRLAPEDGRRPPDRGGAAPLPGGREAPQHLRRRPAAAGRGRTGGSTPSSTRRSPPPAGSRPSRPTCRTSRCGRRAGREFRRAFIPAEGCELLVADYSQIELRLLAHLAHDPGLIEAFQRDADVHTTTAAQGVRGRRRPRSPPSSAASPRSSTTAWPTGWRPTGSASGWTSRPTRPRRSSTPTSPPSRTCGRSWTTTVKEARARGYTTTLMGRRRLLPELSSDNFRIRQMGERMAQNAPVQGGAADIFKLAMVNLDAELEERGHARPGWC